MEPDYSLVIPIYNEEETIPEMYGRLKTVLDQLPGSYELILIDDGSRDRSLELIRELHASDPRVCYVSLARNFGHQVAVTAGLNFARGQTVVILDADLQDPPELIPQMLEKWREGYQVVYAQRSSREQENWVKQFFAYVFYRVLRMLTDVDIPADAGDFCLMDRKVVNTLNSLPERNRYLRGLRAWVGFSQTHITFDRAPRFAGKPKYTFRKSLGLAIHGIVSLSRVPLRLATYVGLFAAGIALMMIVLVAYWRLFHPVAPLIGYTIITAAVFFLGAVQLLSLGILGEYIGLIYEEVKGRPIYTINEIAGVVQPAASQSTHKADTVEV
ncbi:MAG TPA: glycosyltransferase family 2 protein [Pyrinomonadaceae bacterium]|jgi:dolichol-phosphate mannosyltransferase